MADCTRSKICFHIYVFFSGDQNYTFPSNYEASYNIQLYCYCQWTYGPIGLKVDLMMANLSRESEISREREKNT